MQPTIQSIPLLQLASGDRLMLQVYTFTGANPVKKVYIQSNLHGAEIAGNVAIYELIEFLSQLDETQLHAEVRLVPICNPLGTNQRTHQFATGRYNPYDGRDWNRIFWDYEHDTDNIAEFAQAHIGHDVSTIQQAYRSKIQQKFKQLTAAKPFASGVPVHERFRYQLQSLCLDVDYVIDLHSSSNQGLDYLYYFHDRDDSAKFFLLQAGILLDKYDGDAFDEAFIKPWLALEQCFADLNRTIRFDIEAWTLELGTGMQINPSSVAKGVRGIKNYLSEKGILKIPDYPTTQVSYHDIRFTATSKVKKYYATVGGMIQSRVPLGTMVNAGHCLYQILSFGKDGSLPTVLNVEAEEGGLVFDVSTNHAVNEGEYVLGVL
jgi:predicted deacylase